jgi:hypothetical protein
MTCNGCFYRKESKIPSWIYCERALLLDYLGKMQEQELLIKQILDELKVKT